MRAIMLAAIFFMSTLVNASGRIPFLFSPRPPVGVALILGADLSFSWNSNTYLNGGLFDIVGLDLIYPMTLTNDSFSSFSGLITLQIEAHNGAYTIENDNCSYTYLGPGDFCSFDLRVAAGLTPSATFISLDAVQDSTLDRYYVSLHYCPSC